MQKWPIEPGEEPLIRMQLPEGLPVRHNQDEINEPEEEPLVAGH